MHLLIFTTIVIIYLHLIWLALTKIRNSLATKDEWKPLTEAQLRSRERVEAELGD